MSAPIISVSFNEDVGQAYLELIISSDDSVSYLVDEEGELVECRRAGRVTIIGNHHGFAVLASRLTNMLINRDEKEFSISLEADLMIKRTQSIRFRMMDGLT